MNIDTPGSYLVPANSGQSSPLNFPPQTERKFLKVVLLKQLHLLFCELFKNKIINHENHSSLENYAMDSKIIQFLIQDILETGEYTIEGIAYYTHIPFDVIYDAACGLSNQFSITPWTRVVDLYLQVKPNIAKALTNKLIEINTNRSAISSLLTER